MLVNERCLDYPDSPDSGQQFVNLVIVVPGNIILPVTVNPVHFFFTENGVISDLVLEIKQGDGTCPELASAFVTFTAVSFEKSTPFITDRVCVIETNSNLVAIANPHGYQIRVPILQADISDETELLCKLKVTLTLSGTQTTIIPTVGNIRIYVKEGNRTEL